MSGRQGGTPMRASYLLRIFGRLVVLLIAFILTSSRDVRASYTFTEAFCLVGADTHETPFPDGQGWVTTIVGSGVDADGKVAVSLSGMHGPAAMEQTYNGIYVGDAAVVSTDDVCPSTGSNFSGQLPLDGINDGRVYFHGFSGNEGGIYSVPASAGGPVSIVVDSATLVPPDLQNPFGYFSVAGVSSEGAGFAGSDGINDGSLFFRDAIGGDIVPIVDPVLCQNCAGRHAASL